jgi:hypothetical protein
VRHCILLFAGILLLQPLYSENLTQRFSLNLKLSSPLLKSDVPQLHVFVDPGLEAMCHFSIYKGVRLGAGFGFEFGHHIWNKEYASVRVVDGQLRKNEVSYVYHFKFFSWEIPVTVDVPLRGSIINSFAAGVNFGWHSGIDFSLERAKLSKEPVFDRFYIEPNFSLRIPVKKLKRFSISLQPFISKRLYTTHKNDFQENIFLVGYSISTNF